MNKLLAVAAITLALLGSLRAISQAIPVPFNQTVYTNSMDAGFAGALTVLGQTNLGTLTVSGDGGATFNYGALFDGGATFPPGAPINLGASGFYISPDGAGNLNLRFQGMHLMSGWFEADSYVQTPAFYSTLSAINVYAPIVADAGLFVGGGTLATNHCFNVCNLVSQTCNVTCPGNQGTSTCHAFLVGVNSSTLPCRAVADAGSATIICGAASAGDAGVDCWN
jgi:hypothetical protein